MFYDNLKLACAAKKTSPSALCLEMGMSKSNATNWKNGGVPAWDVMIEISKRLECSIDFLLTGESKKPTATKDDELNYIIERMKQLTPEERGFVDGYIQGKLSNR